MDDAYFGYRFLLVAIVILLNAFFAGAEVALVSVRQSRLKQMAAEGQAGAKAALNLLANPERLLSVVQVGVTLASLGLGWAGESTLYALFVRLLGPLATPAMESLVHGACFGVAFLLMTYAHVVIGEVVPKNLAIEKADRVAVLVAPALLVFYRLSGPFVYVIERSASAFSRVLGARGKQLGGGHSAEELKKRKPVRRFDLRHVMRKPFVVPETKPLNQLIDDFRAQHSHMAIVVDEFGTVVGLVTLEDVLEQIFGEIEDEHDAHLPPVLPEARVLELDGTINIRDLETQHGIEVPVDADFETLAGFLLFRLGRIPEAGDGVEHEGYRFTVMEMERNRIAHVRVERIESAGEKAS